MIEVVNSPFLDEAVDADELIKLMPMTREKKSQFRVKRQNGVPISQNGGTIVVDGDDIQINVHPDMVNKAYDYVIKAIFGEDKKNIKTQLEAYGTSEKELREALKYIIAYNTVVAEEGRTKEKSKIKLPKSAEQFKQEIKQQKPFNEKGRIGSSAAYTLAKEMLEKLSDSEFTEVVDMIKTSENLAKDLQKFPNYVIFRKEPKEVFAIDDEEEKRFFDSKQTSLKGVATKAGAKRKVKGAYTSAKDKVTGLKDKAKSAWNAVKNAGQFARGMLA